MYEVIFSLSFLYACQEVCTNLHFIYFVETALSIQDGIITNILFYFVDTLRKCKKYFIFHNTYFQQHAQIGIFLQKISYIDFPIWAEAL